MAQVSRLLLFVCFAVSTSGIFMNAEANRSRLVDVRFEIPESGIVGPVNVTAVIRNLARDRSYFIAIVPPGSRQPVVLTRLNDAANKGLRFSGPAKVEANGQTRVAFQIQVSGRTKQALQVVALIINANGVIIAAERKALYFQAEAGRFKRSNYETAFLPPLESVRGTLEPKVRQIPLGYPPPGAVKKFKPVELGPGVTPNTFFNGNRPWGKFPFPKKSEREQLPSAGLRKVGSTTDWWQELVGVRAARADGPFNLTGQLFFESKAGDMVPAWNWTVQVTQVQAGATRLAAFASVTHTGRWSITLDGDRLDRSLPIYVSYRPVNRMFHIVDRDGNSPAAVEDARPITATSTGLDMGVALMGFSDALFGLGDVYQAGVIMWNGFVSAGISPEPAEPIRVYFPNTWDDCGDGTGVPWSCSSGDTRNIWLAGEHNDAYTIMHELGHSISSKFWSGQPSGAGITHSGDQCYNPGLALSEGFADALAFFGNGLHFVPNPGDRMEGGYDIETVADPSICMGETNEIRVAQSLWDMMDVPNDGRDGFYFGKDRPAELAYGRPGRLVRIMLAARRDAVSQYLSDIRAGITGVPNKDAINLIFNDNSIAVPLP